MDNTETTFDPYLQDVLDTYLTILAYLEHKLAILLNPKSYIPTGINDDVFLKVLNEIIKWEVGLSLFHDDFNFERYRTSQSLLYDVAIGRLCGHISELRDMVFNSLIPIPTLYIP